MADKGEIDEESQDNYQVSKKVTVDELLNMDKEDESLRKYKESLLGQASKEVYSRESLHWFID